MSTVAVIGGGPAGMLAAAEAAKNGHYVDLFEKNEKLGKKLFITGKGRCNITNVADIGDFFDVYPRNAKFLYSALYTFTNQDIIALLHEYGVSTKVERGGRVFPESDKSSDVLRALARHVESSGVKMHLNASVKRISATGDRHFCVELSNETREYNSLVLATGGASYPLTGSTGDGYAFAQMLGHSITEIKPSLVPLRTVETWPMELQGISLKNVTLCAYQGKKKVFEELGEMLFTHFGVSGPLVLSASSRIADAPENTSLEIDLKPGLSDEMLDKRLLRDFESNNGKMLVNSLDALLPGRLIPVIIELSGIAPETQVNAITREARARLLNTLKHVKLTVAGTLDMASAIITRGGVNVKEINASTMESKMVQGLYFAGELIDADAYTGGYNLQLAFSTGVLAGRSIE